MLRHARVSQLGGKENHEYWENVLKEGGTAYRRIIREFLSALRLALRDVSFWMFAENAAYVYREGDSHILGQVMVERTGGEYIYAVTTNKIINARYSSSPDRNTMRTKDLSKALKTAKTFLVPPMLTDCVTFDMELITKLRVAELNVLVRKSNDAMFRLTGKKYSDIGADSPIIRHITAARDKLDFILDAAFLADLDSYIASEKEHRLAADEASANASRSMYVRVEQHGEQVRYSLVPVPKNHERVNPTLALLYDDSDLPDFFREKLAVVSMLAPEQYVSGVGVRLDDKVFIVITD